MVWYDTVWYDMIYLLTAIGLTPSGSSTVHIYTQTIHRTTQSTQTIHRTTQLTNWEECWPCPVFVHYTLAFALQLRKKHGKTSVRVAEDCQLAGWKQNIQNRTYITIRIRCISVFKQVYTGSHSDVDTCSYNNFPTMNDSITSQNIDLSSWMTLHTFFKEKTEGISIKSWRKVHNYNKSLRPTSLCPLALCPALLGLCIL
jgi:hypothetical protein